MKTKKEQKEIFNNLKKEVKLGIKEVLISLKNFDKESTGEILFTIFGKVVGLIKSDNFEFTVHNNLKGNETNATIYHYQINNTSLNKQYLDFCSSFKQEFQNAVSVYNVAQNIVHGKDEMRKLAYDISDLNKMLLTAVENNNPSRYDIQKSIVKKIKELNDLKQYCSSIEAIYPLNKPINQ